MDYRWDYRCVIKAGEEEIYTYQQDSFPDQFDLIGYRHTSHREAQILRADLPADTAVRIWQFHVKPGTTGPAVFTRGLDGPPCWTGPLGRLHPNHAYLIPEVLRRAGRDDDPASIPLGSR
jgi:hypothetical protein